MSRVEAVVLIVLWLAAIAGGAVHILVQRAALAALGLAFIPTAMRD